MMLESQHFRVTDLAYAGAVADEPAEADEATTLRYESAPERRRAILSAVGDTGFVSVTELTRRLGVSDMTVRRDLRSSPSRARSGSSTAGSAP